MYKKLTTINAKIKQQVLDQSLLKTYYNVADDSIQPELRLQAYWRVKLPVDIIHYPKNLRGDTNPLWQQMRDLNYEINTTAKITYIRKHLTKKINSRTKSGPQLRKAVTQQFRVDCGNQFLSDCALAKKNTKKLNAKIADLQAQQKPLLKRLRAANSEYIAERKAEKRQIAHENTQAIASGRFWDADGDALKAYFSPPFEKNYIAAVSKKWRAALVLECESINYKRATGNWGHKLGSTGRGYLCGIDDNGDEWGHVVDMQAHQDYDDFSDRRLGGTVEQAMSELFQVQEDYLDDCG